MPELDHITVKGFRSLASIEKLELGSINVLIGANGSGKSNFISVFSLFRALREGRLELFVAQAGGAERLLHFGSKVTEMIELGLSFHGGDLKYSVKLAPSAADGLRSVGESISIGENTQAVSMDLGWNGKEAVISRADRADDIPVVSELDRWRLYHFHDTSRSSPMKKTQDVNDNRFLRPDASNLASFLYALEQRHESSYQLIRRTVQRIAPFFDDFLLEPEVLNPDKIRLEWRHRQSDAYFDAGSLSDGTLRFMALATLFLQPEELRPSVILVDEPEIGLHPSAITMLASLIRQAATETQVIVSTQSPLLLDHCEPEEILVADLVDGATRLSRLDGEALEEWLEDFSLGQLWEKNELGGRPGGQ